MGRRDSGDVLFAAVSLPSAQIFHSLIIYGVGIGLLGAAFELFRELVFNVKRKKRKRYYNDEYLQSDEWKRKRHVVLKRDNWICVYCGGRATQVHHKRYARRNIGREPIDWLVSVCDECHGKQHE